MDRSVLIVSPCMTHPVEAGNKRRLLGLAITLRELGWRPVLLCTDYMAGDLAATREWWGEDCHFQRHRPGSWRWQSRRWLRPVFRFLPALRRVRGQATPPSAPVPVDAMYEPALDRRIRELNVRYGFSAVIAEYVFMSAALLQFRAPFRRLIDTHELFALGSAAQDAPTDKLWLRLTPEDELAALRRADTALAIQDRDAATLRAAGLPRVITFGHPVELEEQVDPGTLWRSGQVLFVAAGHPFDVDGLKWFATEVYPRLAGLLPASRVVVAGGIREALKDRPPFTFLGRVPDLAPIYRTSQVVIAPLRQGTGLKIKVVEALGRGKALVATPLAARGVESGAGTAFVLANDAATFADKLGCLLRDDAECLHLMAGARRFAEDWNRRQREALRAVLDDPLPGSPAA